MWPSRYVPVAPSIEPAEIEVSPLPSRFQNRTEPQSLQKPRWAIPLERNHVRPSCLVNFNSLSAQAVADM